MNMVGDKQPRIIVASDQLLISDVIVKLAPVIGKELIKFKVFPVRQGKK